MSASEENISKDVDALKISDEKSESCVSSGEQSQDKWGFPVTDLYKLALKFYKEKDGKALRLTYRDKLQMVAYTKQASHGKYRNDVSPDVGFLDVVGNDRRQAWQALGDMSKEAAMEEFVNQLDKSCPLFKHYIEAHKAEKLESIRKRQEEEERLKREAEELERRRLEEEAQKQLELQRQRQLMQEMQIRAALNQQTSVQFAQYAQQQYPGDKQQQEELIRQLQEQHFQQYMQQVYQQQLQHQQQQFQQTKGAMSAPSQQATANQNPQTVSVSQSQPSSQIAPSTEQQQLPAQQQQQQQQPNGPVVQSGEKPTVNGQEEDVGKSKSALSGIQPLSDELPPLAAASMWTRKDLKEFKESLQKDKDSVIKIGSGETVTVRVPTHEDGTCLFWEFATDYYDIGFGVYFEWTIAPNSTVSVHVSESSDEEEFDEEQETKNDVESGSKKEENRPPTDEIIPVYRRDSHEEVYCGSHAYPGQGVYLLKFDNSYSLWRSKTLYYRVYYSR